MDENYECFSVCCYYCCLLLLGLNIKIRTDWRIVSVKFHVRDGRTDEETRLFVRPSVRPSVHFKLNIRDGRTDGQSVRPSVRLSLRWSLTLTESSEQIVVQNFALYCPLSIGYSVVQFHYRLPL